MITNKPKKPQVMASVTVDTKDVEYPEPEKLPEKVWEECRDRKQKRLRAAALKLPASAAMLPGAHPESAPQRS